MQRDKIELPASVRAHEINGPLFFGMSDRMRGVPSSTRRA